MAHDISSDEAIDLLRARLADMSCSWGEAEHAYLLGAYGSCTGCGAERDRG